MMDKKRGKTSVQGVLATVIGCGVAIMLAAGSALAQDAPAQPQAGGEGAGENRVMEFPGEWVKRCRDGAAERFCEISYGTIVDVGERRVWISRIGIFESGDQRDLFMFTPLGTALRRGVLYRIDESAPQTAAFSVCIQVQGCQAITQIDETVINAMKAGNQFQVQFTVANRPPLVGSVTLAGFTAAYDGEPEVTVTDDGATTAPVSDEPPAAAPAVAPEAAGGKGDAPAQ